MPKINNSKATPSKDTGSKNNTSDNDVDFRNGARTSDKLNTNTSNKASSKGSK